MLRTTEAMALAAPRSGVSSKTRRKITPAATSEVLPVSPSERIIRAAQYQRITALGGISQLWGYTSLVYGFGGIALICLCDVIAALMGRRLRDAQVASSLS